MRGATFSGDSRDNQPVISIHAPHAGSDVHHFHHGFYALCISIHAPHAGSDLDAFAIPSARPSFQSTLPMRGATQFLFLNPEPSYFNPRSPCGERPGPSGQRCDRPGFQSTLPMRGATSVVSDRSTPPKFQSTLPMRGATNKRKIKARMVEIFQSTLPMRGATIIIVRVT